MCYAEGQFLSAQITGKRQYISLSVLDVAERGGIDPLSLEERDGQYSRHACIEYCRPILSELVTGEISPECGKWQKTEVHVGLYPAAPPFLPLSCLCRWTYWRGVQGNDKTPCQYPSNQVKADLLLYLWICQELYHYQAGACEPPLHPVLLGANNKDLHPEAVVIGRH